MWFSGNFAAGMEDWTTFLFGPEKEQDDHLVRRALDGCIREDADAVLRIFPTIRPYQLRRLCLFLAGMSDKEVAWLTGDGESAIRVARLRFRRKLEEAGPEGWHLSERIRLRS